MNTKDVSPILYILDLPVMHVIFIYFIHFSGYLSTLLIRTNEISFNQLRLVSKQITREEICLVTGSLQHFWFGFVSLDQVGQFWALIHLLVLNKILSLLVLNLPILFCYKYPNMPSTVCGAGIAQPPQLSTASIRSTM